LLRELLRVDSRNPTLVPGGPGEHAVAHTLRDILASWGLRAHLREAAPGRPNVIARIGNGANGAPTLMFNGHIDVVGIDGMTHDPWASMEQDGKLYGRGASDMKAGVAAMCAAAARLADRSIAGELIVAAVVDEEFESLGTRALIEGGLRADAAIVTEPTQLAIMPAHRGFVWIDVTTLGRAAHGSRWDLGVDAIRHAGLVLAELERLDSEHLPRASHPLLGRPSIHASLIEGGSGMSTYPERCTLRLERRTIPGETPDAVRREIEDVCAAVAARQPQFRAEVTVTLSQPPSDVAVDAPIVRAVEEAIRGSGGGDSDVRIAGGNGAGGWRCAENDSAATGRSASTPCRRRSLFPPFEYRAAVLPYWRRRKVPRLSQEIRTSRLPHFPRNKP